VDCNSRSIKPGNEWAGDVADPKTADRIVEKVWTFRRIDTLITCRNLIESHWFTIPMTTTLRSYDQSWGSPITRRVATEMLKQGSGHIVQIRPAYRPRNSNVPSVLASMTKGGLNAATKSPCDRVRKKEFG